MRTSAQIVISIGMAFGVFGVLVLSTEWGQTRFGPDADLTGAFAMFLAFFCLILGVVVNAFSKTGEPPDKAPGDEEETEGPGTPLCPGSWRRLNRCSTSAANAARP